MNLLEPGPISIFDIPRPGLGGKVTFESADKDLLEIMALEFCMSYDLILANIEYQKRRRALNKGFSVKEKK